MNQLIPGWKKPFLFIRIYGPQPLLKAGQVRRGSGGEIVAMLTDIVLGSRLAAEHLDF